MYVAVKRTFQLFLDFSTNLINSNISPNKDLTI
jgi:hypothetical protein